MKRLLRRSPHLVGYWRGGRFVLENFATGARVEADTLVCEVLDFFDRWRSVGDLAARSPHASPALLRRLIDRLVRHTLLQRADRPRPVETALDAWAPWNPAAGFFHLSTKNVPFVDVDVGERRLRRQAARRPRPPVVKRYARSRGIDLPVPHTEAPFAQVLLARRTWRRFGRAPLSLQDVSTLLNLTAGVQAWVVSRGEGEVPLKTSPSAGARHPIELYVLSRNVGGLAAGLYHYAADRHRLDRLPGRRIARMDDYLPTQSWYRTAAALVLFTAVFPRSMWRYDYARAYRSVLIEAGHVCQTFCLVATWLGMAPFCSMALADGRIERDLGVDGIGESVLYAAGVGSRPPDVPGPPWPPHEPGRIVRTGPAERRRRPR